MTSKLNELTQKIYQEGVSKANEEADKIISEVKKQSDEIIKNAKNEATRIISTAQKEAGNLKENSLSELKLSANQMLSDIKQQIIKLIELKTTKEETSKAFADNDFVKELIKLIIKKWRPDSDTGIDLKILLPEEKKNEFENFFKQKTENSLNEGLVISFSDKIKSGFRIGPKEEGYMISFSDNEFDNFFKSYLRPKLVEILYEK